MGVSKETTSNVDSEAVERRHGNFISRKFHKVTNGLTKAALEISGRAIKGGLVLGGIYFGAKGAKNIYEEATGNTLEIHSIFSEEGFSIEHHKSDKNVVHLQQDNNVSSNRNYDTGVSESANDASSMEME